MATTYLELVNKLNRRVNETELTSANFASADGWYATAKDAINQALYFLAQNDFEWPFFHVEQDDTLVAGTVRYAYQTNAKSVDFDTFRIQRDATFGNDTVPLMKVDYEEYVQKNWIDAEYNTSDTSIRTTPVYVFQTPDQEYGVYPPPDEAYTLTYEYFKYPTALSAFGDNMEYPDSFAHVVVDAAMWYVYLWRRDYESADRIQPRINDQLKSLRTIYINRYDHIRDTRVVQNYPYYTKYVRTN